MQVVENTSYVRSRVKIGNITHLISLALLAAGFLLSLQGEGLGVEAIYAAYVALFGALLLLQFGRNFSRRFGSRFRQDQVLKPMLRRLDDRHTLFNYASPDLPDHLLVGPTGLWVVVPRTQSGKIRFDGRSWSRGSMAGTLLRGLAEGGLGNPLTDVERTERQLATYLQKHGSPELIEGLRAPAIIVFTHPNAQLDVRNLPQGIHAVLVRDLWSIFRRVKPILPPEKVEALKQVIGREVEQA